jgi:hypothetical protein
MQNLQVFAWLIGLSPIRGSLNAYYANRGCQNDIYGRSNE